MKAMVLAAGYGTRLGDLTRDLPKPLLPVAGEPLLGRTLRYLAAQGVRDVVVNLHFRPDLVRAYVGDGSRFGCRVRWSEEPVLLGTAGALKRAAPVLADEGAFLAVYGDLLIDMDLGPLRAAHGRGGAEATIVVHRREGSNSFVDVADDGRVRRFVERPDDATRARLGPAWVNSGVAVVEPAALDRLPAGAPTDLARDLWPALASEGRLRAVPLAGCRVAVDSPARYAEACRAVETGLWKGA